MKYQKISMLKNKIKNVKDGFRYKIKNYLSELQHLYRLTKSNIHLFHHRIVELDVNSVPLQAVKINPYQALLNWSIDVIQYGMIISMIYFPIVNNVTSLLPISFGVGHWFVFDTITKVKDKIKDK